MKLNTYLHFIDNCEEAFNFYAKVFGATIGMTMRFGDSPETGECPPEWEDKILHMQLKVGDTILMGSDSPPVCGETKPMGGFSVSIHLDDPSEAENVFTGLADGANVVMPIQETFWAQRFGMLTDKFGVPWMVSCDKAEISV